MYSVLGRGLLSTPGPGPSHSLNEHDPESKPDEEGADHFAGVEAPPIRHIPGEAVAEFTVLQNQFSAEFGHSSGGQFNTVLRGGTNELHGVLYEYLLNRNNANEIGRMLRGAAVQKEAFTREITAKYQEAMNKPGAMTAALNYYRQLFRRWPQSAAKASRIAASTLLIWGEKDIALGIALTTGLEEWVDNLQVKRIPDSGHWVQQEKPEQVNAFMLEFLQGS